MGYIYKISNDINDKVYIGQTKQLLHQRWSMHKQHSKTLPFILYKAMRKYGIEHFSIEEIEECDDEKLNEREIYWISYYDSYNNGYNMNPGGNYRTPYESAFKDKILQIYDENPNLSYQQIADIVGCSIHPVSDFLNRYNRPSHYKQHQGCPVLQIDKNTGEIISEFKSARDAAIALGKNPGCGTSIRNVCKKKPGYRTAYGYKWKFKE